ncbi:MAG: sialidase family protein [Anaerolineae bacterium]
MLTKTHLFEARTGGYRTYRVPGILATPRGTVLVTAEARPDGGDWGTNDLVMRRRLDGASSWGPSRVFIHHEAYGEGPVSNFVMIWDDEAQVIHALYCHNYASVFAMRSGDEGATFSQPREITGALLPFRDAYPWRVVATGPGHGIQLASGRLIVPLWMSDGSGMEFGAGKLGHRPSEVAVIYSDDHGATWEAGDFVAHTDDRIVNPSETVPVELNDGRVLLNIRSESAENRRLVAISDDGAHDWTTPRFDPALLEPVCMGSILKLGRTEVEGRHPILFANPDNLENELIPPGCNLAHDRKRLTVKMSLDDARTWPVSRVLEAGPAGYSDLAELPDGTVACVYECGMIEHMTDTRHVTVARFDLAWLRSPP